MYKNDALNFIKRLFCKHEYEKIGFREEYDGKIRYSIRNYRCKKCGKNTWIDARNNSYV